MAFWDFLKDANSEKKIAGKAFRFMSNPINTLTLPAKPAEYVIKKATGKDMDVAKFITEQGQSLARVPETVARSVIQHEVGGITKKDYSSGKNLDPIRKALYGEAPVQTYQKRAEGNKKVLEGSRLKDVAGPLSFLGAALTVAGDIPGLGGAEKDVAELVAKETTEQGVKSILKKVGIDIADDTAKALASTKDKNIVENIIKKIPSTTSTVEKVNPVIQNISHPAGTKPKSVFQDKTEIEQINRIIKNEDTVADGKTKIGDYYRTAKGEDWRVEKMSPDDYLKRAAKAMGVDDAESWARMPMGDPDKYAADMAKGDKFPMPWINEVAGSQEGRTRALAAKKLGIEEIPVAVGTKPLKRDIVSATIPKIEPPKVIARMPMESPELVDFVKRGKLSSRVDTAPINSLKIGSDSADNIDPTRVAKYVQDIKDGKTLDPLVIDSKGLVQDGKHRLEAMKRLGVKEAPVVEQIAPKKLYGAAQQSKLAKEPFDEILGAVKGTPGGKGQAPVKGAVTAMKEQEKLLKAERGARFKAGAEAGKTAQGSEGYFKELKALKGEYSKADFHPMINDIGPERAEQLFTSARQKILDTPDSVYEDLGLHAGGARLNTQRAVRKVLGLEPGIPTRSELKLLGVYSPKLAEGIKEATPLHRKLFDFAATVFGNSRSAKSTLDLSMGGRQGLFVAARHPKEWAKANLESIKYAKDAKYFNSEMKAIHDDEWGKLIDKYNKSVLTGGVGHEEQYAATDLVGKVPGVKAAERAYTGGLTKLRKDVLTRTLSAYGETAEEAEKALGEKGMKGLIEAVSTLTGRGGKAGGFVDKHATTLQEALFSPRLWASRLQPLNPAFWSRIGPAGRKEALQSLGSFAAVVSVVLGAAVAAGAEVETDPRSSDFLKIKVGDTRYDILGGFQQNIVFGARQLSNSTKSSTTGAVTKYGDKFGGPTRLSAAADLVRNKANPVLGSAANILEGKDKAGNKVNPLTEVGQLFVPINIQNAFNSRNNPKDILKSAPTDFVGIGSQTYGVKDTNISDKQKATISKLTDKKQQEAYTRFYQTAKLARGTRANVSDQINEALAKKDLKKAKQLAADYNKSYSSAFKDWRDKYRDYSDATLLKEYNANKINLTNASVKTRLKALQ